MGYRIRKGVQEGVQEGLEHLKKAARPRAIYSRRAEVYSVQVAGVMTAQ